jgi:hypothetical protein
VPVDPDAKSLLEKLFAQKVASDRECFSMASVAQYVAQGNAMQHTRKRQQAQVDAMLKAKYEACGIPEAYEPPSEDGDEVANTLINCNFWGDEAVQNVAQSIEAVVKDEPKDEPAPDQPTTTQPAQPNGWSKWFKSAILGASLIGAGGLGAIVAQWLSPTATTIVSGQKDTDTRNVIRPDTEP